jgi:hypothetical protein
MKKFSSYFRIKKLNGQFYTWFDFEYKQMMLEIFGSLVPRFEAAENIILDEFDEINELLFFNEGKIGIGYTINHLSKYCVFKEDNCIIGT